MKSYLYAQFRPFFILFLLSLVTISVTAQQIKQTKFIEKKAGVEGRYIVLFNESAVAKNNFREAVASHAEHFSSMYGGKVDSVFSSAVAGFVLTANEDQAKALSSDPRVKLVEQDSYVNESAVQTPAVWGLDRLDQRTLPLNSRYTYEEDASNVHAYIIDSGIRPTHAEFGGRATADFDALTETQNAIDCSGHGTHVAGTIGGATFGIAKNVRLHGVRVLPCSGPGLVSHVLMGIDWVTSNHISPAVANLSISVSPASTALENFLQASINSGVTYVVTAGNGNIDACTISPGRLTSAIVVGGLNSNDTKGGYSNWGSCVDIWAPGTSITSASIANDTATQVMSGTSMATPHVAGLAALYLARNPSATNQQVQEAIRSTATSGAIVDLEPNSPNLIAYSWLNFTPPPTEPGRVTIRKRVSSRLPEGGSPASFNYQATNFTLPSFSLTPDRTVDSDVSNFGSSNSITVSEAVVPGWTLASIQCTESSADGTNEQNTTVDISSRSANIVVEEGETIDCTFTSSPLVPTAASVSISGRVLDQKGRGIRGASIQVMDAATGIVRTVVTNSFGRYKVSGLPVEHLYMLTANPGRKYPGSGGVRTFTLSEDLFDVDFEF